jgi:demethylmenaquinone methyltransferase/2-methoxy-6-polyprenyl-1,4-benzoquinol methylase
MSATETEKNTDSKKQQVESMFNSIAPKYDFLNHFLSMGIDHLWRKKTIKQLKSLKPKTMLDVATGTGDLAICALKNLNPDKITGIDISEQMLEFGKKKLIERRLNDKINLLQADSENIPFEDNSFNAITVGFGVRNFENLEKGLKEMRRVLTPGGKVAILEFSKPRKFPIKQLYNFYFKYILPTIGKIVSKDNRAYTYLPESVSKFPDREDFIAVLNNCGYQNARFISLSFGIASIYIAEK